MTFIDLLETLRACFEPVRVENYPEEFGHTAHSTAEIRRVGYATNLDPLTVAAAAEADTDALITHHDAWDFLFELREEAYALLEKASISHCFVHLPLDAAPFGTSAALGERIGLEMGSASFAEEDGFLCGRVGTFATPVPLGNVAARLREVTAAGVRVWPYGPEKLSVVGITTGGGSLSNLVREAIDLGCDTYITGESNVYVVQYARNRGINLVVGTHTHTEFPGVESLCGLLAARTGLEFVPIREADFETGSQETT
ncbi:MAG: Nif3-like dinuclear metal center hexameric protein [Candidatus Bipolaricaulota bacterium]|nr:MAG: Nif3-like dinuclear metal center hexameric protein [Candidatus Bipolaricaulota bacterium]